MARKRSRLKRRREELRPHVSVEAMARRCDVDKRTVRRWENGESDPYERQHEAIAQGYEWPRDRVHELLLRDDELIGPPTGSGHDGDVDRRDFLAGLGGSVAGTALVSAGVATPVPPEIVGYLAGQLTAHWQADRVLGPHLLIDHVVSQCHTVTRGVDATTGALHKELVQLATAYSGLVAWLYQDMGDIGACNRWLSETLEMGHRSRDPQLVAYALTCKAMVRLDVGDAVGAIDFAEAALATTPQIADKARAMALQHAAQGYAMLGDRAAVDRLLDEIGQLLEALASDRHPWGGDRLRHDPNHALNVQRATCYERLGLADESAALWAEVMSHPPHERRDRGVHLARQAMALVDVGDPAGATGPATEGAEYLAATGSARMRSEFTRLRRKASAWSGTPAGRELVDVLDATA